MGRSGEWLTFPIKARPGARRNAMVGEHGNRLKVEVTAPPEKGKANSAICELVAQRLGVGTARVSIVQGETSPLKVVAVLGMEESVLRERLRDWCQSADARGDR